MPYYFFIHISSVIVRPKLQNMIGVDESKRNINQKPGISESFRFLTSDNSSISFRNTKPETNSCLEFQLHNQQVSYKQYNCRMFDLISLYWGIKGKCFSELMGFQIHCSLTGSWNQREISLGNRSNLFLSLSRCQMLSIWFAC